MCDSRRTNFLRGRWLVGGHPHGPLFFPHQDGADLIQDPEGSELATMEDARSQALKSARELWADAIKSGRSLGADAVVIADEHGGLTFVPMAEALPKRPG